ncbi:MULTISPECIES: DUF1479 domain-containing protein [Pseudomonas]|jgi:hypothetical protein|uniref:Uncharacterized protein DUF1479 n=2 Tax=Pseudomonas TaxID=286 RepID=A0A7Z1GWJ9_9PSED|nr:MULTISPECIES: DUF1479 domain-containing protein [Pseudomonas]MBJ2231096.1 DUF1479 domain-containing protein [Pseudomonas simiae]MCF5047568.1 DUF1479 family protein [Pseudomonas simiae]MCF5186496.1 DUF1479 family protein [Pseudomonas simiae]MCF5285338.1 DUF1479 family protein [Pseudomonas simiae]MCF5319595.1 DUF1479 family protein [Pseudomonas simiae]
MSKYRAFESETLPQDYRDSIVKMKRALRAQIGDVESLFEQVSEFIVAEIDSIKAQEALTGSAWPILEFEDIAVGKVSADQLALIKRRGCVVLRNHFPREQVLGWDERLLDYLDRNHFDAIYRGPADQFFGSLEASRPEIFPIYWSESQMQLRQDERMGAAQSFLNRLWKIHSQGRQWFNPDINALYPDRVRRRPPGTHSKGLGPHTDSGALERWLHPAYLKVFDKIYSNDFSAYDPWDAAFRTEVDEYAYKDTVKCSAFRTFQGWTALSDMNADQGVLHTLPIPKAMAYMLLRPLLDDVPEDELCGVAPGKVLPVSRQWHPLLFEGLSPIPDVRAGDSVWWHCDVIHSVAPVANQQGWGNVMYVPAAPMCQKNLRYAKDVFRAFAQGASPDDFPREDYETTWEGRFTLERLNALGRAGLGLE